MLRASGVDLSLAAQRHKSALNCLIKALAGELETFTFLKNHFPVRILAM